MASPYDQGRFSGQQRQIARLSPLSPGPAHRDVRWMEPRAGSTTARWSLILSILLLGGLLLLGTFSAWADTSSPHVSLIIDFADGAQRRYDPVPWRKGMTVLDVMNYAQKHSHGTTFAYRGQGSTTFLTKIDDLANQGGDGRNWIYRVGQNKADRSFAIYRLEPDDVVLWRFERYP